MSYTIYGFSERDKNIVSAWHNHLPKILYMNTVVFIEQQINSACDYQFFAQSKGLIILPPAR
ncbi:hypothetical protein MRY16398_26600 [Phytobacter sp. MRY16-398]|nr:hypothetical protein MRY16398_26600 [Phytobacter sp. MRY16-398]